MSRDNEGTFLGFAAAVVIVFMLGADVFGVIGLVAIVAALVVAAVSAQRLN